MVRDRKLSGSVAHSISVGLERRLSWTDSKPVSTRVRISTDPLMVIDIILGALFLLFIVAIALAWLAMDDSLDDDCGCGCKDSDSSTWLS